MPMKDYVWHRLLRRPYRLAVQSLGAEKPTVILLHGVGARGAVWQGLARLLRPFARVIIPDLLGFGNSPTPQWNAYTVQEHTRMLWYSLKKLSIQGPVTVVGHSMGCLVAVHLASRHPAFVDRLILYEPPLFADDPDYGGHMRWRRRYFALYEFIASHPQLAFTQRQLLWRLAKRIAGFKLAPAQWEPFARSLRNTIMQQTAYQELHSIALPTDIIHGRLDLIVTRSDLRKMYRANKHITWHTVTDTHGISARSARYMFGLIRAGL